ncbi:MAG: hypothetical protein ACOC6E_03335, partial [Thermodesulfobacteriota bacterium]
QLLFPKWIFLSMKMFLFVPFSCSKGWQRLTRGDIWIKELAEKEGKKRECRRQETGGRKEEKRGEKRRGREKGQEVGDMREGRKGL